MMAIYQELPHWLYLTTYRDEVKDGVRMFLDRNFSQLTNGLASNEYEFIHQAIYSEFTPGEEEGQQSWNENLEHAAWLLRRMAGEILRGFGVQRLQTWFASHDRTFCFSDSSARSRWHAAWTDTAKGSPCFVRNSNPKRRKRKRVVTSTAPRVPNFPSAVAAHWKR